MKGREYHEDAYVGVVGKNIETEGGDKLGKVTDVLITKGTKEIVIKVSQGRTEKRHGRSVVESAQGDRRYSSCFRPILRRRS